MGDRESAPRVAVVGAGAIGCVFAALVKESAGDVVVVSRRRDVVSTINADGIVLHDRSKDDGQDHHVSVRALVPEDAAEAGTFDVVFLVNKSMDAEWAVDLGQTLCDKAGLVISVQNGLRSADIVEDIDSGVAGTTYQGAAYDAAGEVTWTLLGPTIVAPRPALFERTTALMGAISTPSFPVNVVADRDVMIWEKLLGAISNSVSGVLLEPVSAVVHSDSAWEVMEKARAEVFDVAAALGVGLDRGKLEQAFAPRPRTRRSTPGSTFQSLSTGRTTEIADISGAVVESAAQVGLPAPYNEILALLVRAREELAT